MTHKPKRERVIFLRVTPHDHDQIKKAAASAGQTVSQWAIDRLELLSRPSIVEVRELESISYSFGDTGGVVVYPVEKVASLVTESTGG